MQDYMKSMYPFPGDPKELARIKSDAWRFAVAIEKQQKAENEDKKLNMQQEYEENKCYRAIDIEAARLDERRKVAEEIASSFETDGPLRSQARADAIRAKYIQDTP